MDQAALQALLQSNVCAKKVRRGGRAQGIPGVTCCKWPNLVGTVNVGVSIPSNFPVLAVCPGGGASKLVFCSVFTAQAALEAAAAPADVDMLRGVVRNKFHSLCGPQSAVRCMQSLEVFQDGAGAAASAEIACHRLRLLSNTQLFSSVGIHTGSMCIFAFALAACLWQKHPCGAGQPIQAVGAAPRCCRPHKLACANPG